MTTENVNLSKMRMVLTIILLFNITTWVVADLFMPNSHYNSPTWPLHTRVHVGASAAINGFYILAGLFLIWRPIYGMVSSMRLVAFMLAMWNIVFLAFALLIVPSILVEGDVFIHWGLDVAGAGNADRVAEGLVLPMAGIPAAIMMYIWWRLGSVSE